MPDLFDDFYPPDTGPTLGEAYAVSKLARATDPATSHAAAQAGVESGSFQRWAEVALWAVRTWPRRTASELEREYESHVKERVVDGCLRKRLTQLESAGTVRRCGQRVCSVTGKMATMWEACG